MNKLICGILAYILLVGNVLAEEVSIQERSGDLKVEDLSPPEKKEVLREILKSGAQLKLRNFETNEVDVISDPYSMTKEEALKYLPPDPTIVEIFNIYAKDNPPYAALIKSYGDLQKML